MNDEIYIAICNKPTDPALSLGEAIRETTFTSKRFKSVYHFAISIGGITDPDTGYRQALERVKNEVAITIGDKLGPRKVTIARVKNY